MATHCKSCGGFIGTSDVVGRKIGYCRMHRSVYKRKKKKR